VRVLNSRPNEGVITRTPNQKNAGPLTNEVPSSSTSRCDPGSPSHTAVEAKASASVEVSDSTSAQFEAPWTPTEALLRSSNNQRSISALNNYISKRRSRRGNRAPITISRADFQVMVQQMTGPSSKKTAWSSPLFEARARVARLRLYRVRLMLCLKGILELISDSLAYIDNS